MTDNTVCMVCERTSLNSGQRNFQLGSLNKHGSIQDQTKATGLMFDRSLCETKLKRKVEEFFGFSLHHKKGTEEHTTAREGTTILLWEALVSSVAKKTGSVGHTAG